MHTFLQKSKEKIYKSWKLFHLLEHLIEVIKKIVCTVYLYGFRAHR